MSTLRTTTTTHLRRLAVTGAVGAVTAAGLCSPQAAVATAGSVTPGHGWVVVATSDNTATTPGATGPYTLALVSPTGARHVVATSAKDLSVLDVTRDGRRALTASSTTTTSELLEWDLTTGTSHVVDPAFPAGFGRALYVGPSGQRLLVSDYARSTVDLVDLSGRVVKRYATSDPNHLAVSGDGTRVVVPAPSGTGLRVVDSATAKVLRTVAAPTGYASCTPSDTWDASSVTVQCLTSSGDSSDMATVSATTGLRLLTHTTSTIPAELQGYVGAWKVGKAVVAQRLSNCFIGPVGLVGAAGRVQTELTWPGQANSADVVGVAGTSVVAAFPGCIGSAPVTPLLTQDVVTHEVAQLASAVHLSAAVVGHR